MKYEIQCIIQKKIKSKWEDLFILDIEKNCGLFGVSESVKDSDRKLMSIPKGLLSDLETFEHMEEESIYQLKELAVINSKRNIGFYMGDHDFSYLTLDEVKIYPWIKLQNVYIQAELQILLSEHEELRNLRMVFGFNSSIEDTNMWRKNTAKWFIKKPKTKKEVPMRILRQETVEVLTSKLQAHDILSEKLKLELIKFFVERDHTQGI